MPLKLDEGNENTEIKPEEESEEKGVEIGEMKNKQGPKGRVDAHTHRRPRPHLPDPADLRWSR
jgi:hypothetical protein